MSDGGGLSLENTCHGIGLIKMSMEFLTRDVLVWVLIFFFFLLLWALNFLLGAKSCFWAGEVGLALLHFLLFIVVCRDPWSSWS